MITVVGKFKFAAALAFCFSACATTGVTQVGNSKHTAKSTNCSLDVYAAREDVKRPFESVGLIFSESGRTLFNDRSNSGRMKAARKEACKVGADAIVVRDASRSATTFGVGYSQARVSIEAIVYK